MGDANLAFLTSSAFHEHLFQRIAKVHLGEPVTGVLLIYPSCVLHILESSSGTLYHILKELAASENQGPEPFLRDVKILVMSHNIPTKLFMQWYATAVEVPETLEDITQTQTTEEVITECLTLILRLGVYLATLKVGSKGLADCLHSVVPELLIPMETIKCLCRAEKCLSPREFLDMYNRPLQPIMDSVCSMSESRALRAPSSGRAKSQEESNGETLKEVIPMVTRIALDSRLEFPGKTLACLLVNSSN
ncbi:testis-expressed protein 47 [Heteronotia binoei]|uniref:testis-expressed protein 47 n=1 Tax=Heteronotia binoei TaxID=13085 RepID=UPI00292E2F9F|nr:testis-expressed protein 47 [Heteronotia binoei]